MKLYRCDFCGAEVNEKRREQRLIPTDIIGKDLDYDLCLDCAEAWDSERRNVLYELRLRIAAERAQKYKEKCQQG